ncbi:hypothetical protein HYX00_05720 [Candidatus Woesearchaeota archaeon]|nr:hypothetical protein [Candidatus Woesearchaeota archaeon]
MLFFKSKHKYDEILPPPPPFPTMEFEEEFKEKPKFFDEVIKPKRAETFPEEEEFSELVKGLEGTKPKKSISKKEKIIPKKVEIAKHRKILKKELKQLKKVIPVKQIKEKKLPTRLKAIEKGVKKPKTVELPKLDELEEDFTSESADFELPKELEELPKKEIELPETLEDLDIEDIGKDLGLEQETKKPKEILEAEEEIKSAIEKIKEQEKPSLFKRLFKKKESQEKPSKEQLSPEFPDLDEISAIQNKIDETRQALMKLDLETAKRNYIEIMRMYNNIKPEEQAKVYHDIRDIYFERKSAEELKV